MADTLSELTSQDIIDSRDIIARFEELQEEKEALEEAINEAKEALQDKEDEEDEDQEEALEELSEAVQVAEKELSDWLEENKEELEDLERVNDECSGYGDWDHGETLISEDYFPQYAEELANDTGAVGGNSNWIVIDWDATADNLKADYTTVDINGKTYYYRA